MEGDNQHIDRRTERQKVRRSIVKQEGVVQAVL